MHTVGLKVKVLPMLRFESCVVIPVAVDMRMARVLPRNLRI